ncbi:MAG: hypothetical protein AAF962_13560 [Actinomycetota bacterium]
MRRPIGALVGLVLCAVGLVVASFPIVSAWRVSGEVLDELPEVPAATTVEDTRHRLALAHPDFLLAERRYRGVTVDEVEAALRADGFSGIAGPTPAAGTILSKDCCGEYDAVWVTVVDDGAGATTGVRAEVTVADTDIQAVAPTVIALGALVAVIGAVLMIGGARPAARLANDDAAAIAPEAGGGDGDADGGHDTMPV